MGKKKPGIEEENCTRVKGVLQKIGEKKGENWVW